MSSSVTKCYALGARKQHTFLSGRSGGWEVQDLGACGLGVALSLWPPWWKGWGLSRESPLQKAPRALTRAHPHNHPPPRSPSPNTIALGVKSQHMHLGEHRSLETGRQNRLWKSKLKSPRNLRGKAQPCERVPLHSGRVKRERELAGRPGVPAAAATRAGPPHPCWDKPGACFDDGHLARRFSTCGPRASSSSLPWGLSELQFQTPHPRPAESGTRGLGSHGPCLNKPSR